VLPYWERLRRHKAVAAAFNGVNAVVVGILLAALYDPIWTTTIRGHSDVMLAVGAFAALVFWNVPPLAVVVAVALGGAARALW
jgi:chromate transporter